MVEADTKRIFRGEMGNRKSNRESVENSCGSNSQRVLVIVAVAASVLRQVASPAMQVVEELMLQCIYILVWWIVPWLCNDGRPVLSVLLAKE